MLEISDWIGKTEARGDILHAQPAQFMETILDRPPHLAEGSPLPPLWHWLYFLEAKPLSELGRDGHPKKGGFLPPVALPRRMWAGGRFEFHAPLRLGTSARKVSRIASIRETEGRSGKLCFVTVRHEIFAGPTLAVSEEHDIVYREDPKPGAPRPAPPMAPLHADVTERITPSEVMLFRYSALMFNGHRIHYDADYAREVEGYAGLVFHGPLTATLLADLAVRTTGKPLKTFSFRGLAPLAGMTPFDIEGSAEDGGMHLWARRADGACAMDAKARF